MALWIFPNSSPTKENQQYTAPTHLSMLDTFSMNGLNSARVDTVMIYSLLEKAKQYQSSNQEKAFSLATRSLELAEKQQFKPGIARSYYSLGVLFLHSGNSTAAQQYFLESLDFYTEYGSQQDLINLLEPLGTLAIQSKNYLQALDYFKQVLSIKRKWSDDIPLIYSLNNVGKAYSLLGHEQDALHHFREALGLAYSMDNAKLAALTFSNLGSHYMLQKQYKKGVSHFNRALDIYKEQNLEKETVYQLNLLIEAQLVQGEHSKELLKLAYEAYSLSKNLDDKELVNKVHDNLAEVHALLGDYKSAFQFKKLVSNTRVETSKSIAYPNRYNTAPKLEMPRQYVQEAFPPKWLIFLLFLSTSITGSVLFYLWNKQKQTLSQLKKKNAELAISKATLEKFTHAASHELKEPLRTIGSFSTLLNKRFSNKIGKEGDEYVGFITGGVNKMYTLLNDLVVYTSLLQEKGTQTAPVDLKTVVHKVEEKLQETFPDKTIQLQIPEVLPVIAANPEQMQQVFQNLANNAAKFNDNSTVDIKIDYQHTSDGLQFMVQDNGIGIEKEYHEQIFQVFQRLSNDPQSGSGIGLAVCKQIIEKQQGKIWLESEIGHGTTFYFTIPNTQN